jgi:hypothetical protein
MNDEFERMRKEAIAAFEGTIAAFTGGGETEENVTSRLL